MNHIGVRRKLTLVGAALLLAVVGVLVFAPVASAQGIGFGQGQMAGEVTTESVILQSRLTVNGDPLVGTPGVAQFEVSTNPGFTGSFLIPDPPISVGAATDYIIKKKVTGLNPGTRYYYRLKYGVSDPSENTAPTCTFKTLDSPNVAQETSFVVITGMNYFKFHYVVEGPPDKHLGYPGLETISGMNPDFVVATGDNVYYDAWPVPKTTQAELREEWHMQFIQPRFLDLFSHVPFYWMKDDHDFRYDDADNGCLGEPPSPQLGINTFLEQVPVVDPDETSPITYRTYRINELVQIWLLEGRDYRSENMMDPADPNKTIWGDTQEAWLKQTLLASDAEYKFLISPTPMIGPDDLLKPWATPCQDEYRRDNHTNPLGFKGERDAFFTWLEDNGFLQQNFYILCGDRHWKYYSISPEGFEEYSSGAICDANSRVGIAPGDPNGNDPDGLITQPYIDAEATGGFLKVTVTPGDGGSPNTCEFVFYDENGLQLYPPVPYPDLEVHGVSQEWIEEGVSYNVTFRVCNDGDAGASASVAGVYIDGSLEDEVNIEALPDNCTGIRTSGPYTVSGESDTVMVCADIYDTVGESYEDNNCRTARACLNDVASGWATVVPAIDGVFNTTPGEWADAEQYTAGTATIYLKNDSKDLYMAAVVPDATNELWVSGPNPDLADVMFVLFDDQPGGGHDHVLTDNSEDGMWMMPGIGGGPPSSDYSDIHWSSQCPNGFPMFSEICPDGTQNGTGMWAYGAEQYVYEFQKPLNSGDPADMHQSTGQTVGMAMLFLNVTPFELSQCPPGVAGHLTDANYFGNLELAGSPQPDGDGGGCFIATAAYGSYLDSHVETLRDFRDSYMLTNPVGSALVSAYYDISPPLAEFIDEHPTLKPIVRVGLMPAVALSTVAVNTTLAEKIAMVSGLALVSLALGIWLRRRAFRKMTC